MAETETVIAIIIAIMAILISVGAIVLVFIHRGPAGPTGATGATGASGTTRSVNPIGWMTRTNQPELEIPDTITTVILDKVDNYNGATWTLNTNGEAIVPFDGTYKITYSCTVDVIQSSGDNYPVFFTLNNNGQVSGSQYIVEFHTDIHEVTQGLTVIANLTAGSTIFIQTQGGTAGRYAIPASTTDFGQIPTASLLIELISG